MRSGFVVADQKLILINYNGSPCKVLKILSCNEQYGHFTSEPKKMINYRIKFDDYLVRKYLNIFSVNTNFNYRCKSTFNDSSAV